MSHYYNRPSRRQSGVICFWCAVGMVVCIVIAILT